jgi:hypothetical protein
MQQRIIELEETVKVRHQIFVAYSDEEELERAIENFEGDNLDDIVESIGNYVTVTDVNEEYYAESEEFEYFDDYEVD